MLDRNAASRLGVPQGRLPASDPPSGSRPVPPGAGRRRDLRRIAPPHSDDRRRPRRAVRADELPPLPQGEASRVSRRLHSLRGWGHGKTEQVLPRGPGRCGTDGAGAARQARVAVGGDHLDRREVRPVGLRRRDTAGQAEGQHGRVPAASLRLVPASRHPVRTNPERQPLGRSSRATVQWPDSLARLAGTVLEVGSLLRTDLSGRTAAPTMRHSSWCVAASASPS
jgi:hypothetical protein